MGSVIEFPGVTMHEVEPEKVLDLAGISDLSEVTIIGTTVDGEVYYASSLPDAGHILLRIEEFKMALLREFTS
jgi:hypothetical protein